MSYSNKILGDKKGKFFRSITFQSWINFFLFSFIVVCVMVASFVVVYSLTYARGKVDEIVAEGNLIVGKYPDSKYDKERMQGFEGLAEDRSRIYNLSVAVFSVDGPLTDVAESDISFISFHGQMQEAEVASSLISDGVFFEKLASISSDTFYYTTVNKKLRGTNIIIGGRKSTNEGVVYFYMESLVLEKDFATEFFSRAVMYIAFFTFFTSLIYAWFISKRITAPIVSFTKQVKKTGRKNANVKLVGNGYEEIDDLAKTLTEAISEQKKSEEFRRDLVANVSHDLRTPLTMIKAYAEMIKDLSGDNPKKREEHCQIIINEVDTLNALVGDLLDLSKIEAGTVVLNVKSNDLADIVKHTLERLDIFRTRDGYLFITDIDEGCTCDVDADKIEQVMYNLICNAINYTGEDKSVTVSLKDKGEYVRFEVKDTGKGIKQEELAYIWDRYYRASQAKRTVVGSGIGLAIVQNILKKHNARFGVESKEGAGTTFWFEFDKAKNNTQFS